MIGYIGIGISAGAVYTLWDDAIFWRFITIPVLVIAVITHVLMGFLAKQFDAQYRRTGVPSDLALLAIPDWIAQLNMVSFIAGLILLIIGFFL